MTKIMRQANTQIAQRKTSSLKKDTKTFIEDAKKVHGDLYDYSKVVYINAITKVEIISTIGSFFQTPNSHLSGSGDKRINRKVYDTASFICEAKKVHGDLYDYSKVNYLTFQKNVEIISEFGSFFQTPLNHLRKSGDRRVTIANKIKKHSETFIKKAREVHGDLYDYSKVIYMGNKKPVEIISEFGSFFQIPSVHLNGSGDKRYIKPRTSSTAKFIKKARKIYGDKYDYSKVIYDTVKTKITIICPIYGEFITTPDQHLRGIEYKPATNKTLSFKNFKKNCIKAHGDKYDYSKVTYVNNWTKVKIICKSHGVFSQAPSNHFLGRGCPKCKQSTGETKIETFLNKYNIGYKQQQVFAACKNVFILKFDFYLPDHNMCIEFDGKQHFKPIKFFGGMKSFLETVRNDTIKKYFCEDNKIDLLRISYKEFNKIEDILSERLLGK